MTKPKLIICTLGGSLAGGCEAQKALFQNPGDWEADNAATRQLKEELKVKQQRFMREADNIERRHALCAELNVIDRLGVTPHDSVVLLATDTAMGRLCGEALCEILMELYQLPQAQVVMHRIEDLQVQDAKRLRQHGIYNLLTTMMDKYLDNPEYAFSHEVLLSPLGGYKGLVPFVALLGMLYGKTSVYLFEHTNELIPLPPLPISYDKENFNRAQEAIAFVEQASFIEHEDAFLHRVSEYQPYEREYFMSYLEPYDGQWTLSPLALVMKRIEGQRETPAVVHPGAFEQLQKAQGKHRDVLVRLIEKSADKVWRDGHSEKWHSTDLLVIRQNATPERLAGFVDNAVFHVTHAFTSHDEYERVLEGIGKNAVARFQADRDVFRSLEEWQDVLAQRSQQDVIANAEQAQLQATLEASDARCEQLLQRLEASQAEHEQAERAHREALADAEQALAKSLQHGDALQASLSAKDVELVARQREVEALSQEKAQFISLSRWQRLKAAWMGGW